jgi:acyl carrier protein phosphodiesterase
VPYAVENAIFQWEEGERRLSQAPEPAHQHLEQAVEVVVAELRRRLGSSFTLGELADFYASGIDWATDLAQRADAGTDSAWVVDAAFNRYAREASDYGGGRRHEPVA